MAAVLPENPVKSIVLYARFAVPKLIESAPALIKKSIAVAAEPPAVSNGPVIDLVPPAIAAPVISTRREPVKVKLVAVDVV